MPKVSVILILYNSKKFIKPVMDAVLAQTHKDLEIIAVVNADDGAKGILQRNYPQAKIIEPGQNLGFAGGNNLGIKNSSGEFIQLVNPDLILEPDYIENLLKVFENPQVAAATGKLLRYDFEKNQKTNIIDSTGVVMSSSGRARDRGQLEQDNGQYDYKREVFGVSGAGPMYRRSALEKVKYCGNNSPRPPLNLRGGETASGKAGELYCEYFDEDFVAYWEDVDLSWRLNRAGFKNVYVPEAVAYHGRTAGQAKGGYLKIFNFIKHHSKLSPVVRRLNYKNHILMYIKNAKFIFHPAFILREIAMLGYIILLEMSTLKVLPQLLRQIPRMLKKRAAGTNLG
ncbi:MAG: glycosyltransferase family 2 protein [Candidatus Doudnabacteria bacterium]|nr:glycosyltransferase family 2 protein [Candidatus Doudnabacteria bacterium]